MQAIQVIRGDQTSSYVVDEERADGSLVIRPQSPVEAMFERQGSRRMTDEEFQALIAPHVGPPDDEG